MKSIDNLPEYLTINQFAELFQLAQATVYRMLTQGRLNGFRIAGDGPWRIPRQEVYEMIQTTNKTDRQD